jgi:hypothetical protein
MVPMSREANLQAEFIKSARRRGIFAEKLVSKSARGWPDVFLARDGRVVLVETKTPVGRLSLFQQNTHRKLKSAGVEVYVAHTAEECRALLDSFGG